MVTSDSPHADDELPDLPEPVETALYEILLDAPPPERGERVQALCREHHAHEQAIRARVAMMATGDRALEQARRPLRGSVLPERIAGYDIEALLGEGGFGVVYRARQHRPVERTVALKLLHPLRLDERSRWRFHAERQVLARMQHRNIAQIYDAGTTDEGLHYFAMEFVDGLPITTWCDRRMLSIDARVALFADVCAAVQHAHQRGVVHRDLSPSNVLVKDEGGRAVAKVIDFGVAKLLEEQASPLATRDGAMIGTPGYMSPEQVGGGAVDTRTDVYTLGVLLYELLAGDLPFRREQLAAPQVVEVLRVLQHEEPRRLTAAAAANPRGVDEVAARRGTAAAPMLRALRSDLQWVVRRAMAKDPEHRYASVGDLLADIERFESSLPVAAREPHLTYVLRRFVVRHRIAAAVTSALVLAVATVVVVLLWMLGQVDEARLQAEDRERSAVRSAYAANIAAARAGLEIDDVATTRRLLREAETSMRGWEWSYLTSLCDTSEVTLPATSDSGVARLVWLDDDRLCQLHHDGSATQWRPSSPDGPIYLPRIASDVHAVAFDRERQRLFVLGENYCGVRVVHTATGFGRRLWSVGPRRADRATDIRSLAPSRDGRWLAVSQNNGAVTLLDLVDGAAPREWFRREGPCWRMVFGPDDATIVLGTRDGFLEVRGRDGQLLGRRALDREGVKRIVLTDGGRRAIVAAGSKLHKIDLQSLEVLQRVEVGTQLVDLDLSNDERFVYGASPTSLRVAAWRTDTLELAGRFHGQEAPSSDIRVSPDGRLLACTSRGATRVWSARPQQPFLKLAAGFTASDLGVDPGARAFAIGNLAGEVRVWRARDCELVLEAKVPSGVTGCALTDECVYVAGTHLFAVDRADGAVHELAALEGSWDALAVDGGGRRLCGVSASSGRLRVWSLPDGEARGSVTLERPGHVAWHAASGCFVASCRDEVVFARPDDGVVVRRVAVVGDVRQVACDGADCLAASDRGLWCITEAGATRMATGASAPCSVAVGPTGRRIAGGDPAGVARLWDRRGTELLTLADAPRALTQLRFVDGGRRLIGLSFVSGNQCYVMAWGPDLR